MMTMRMKRPSHNRKDRPSLDEIRNVLRHHMPGLMQQYGIKSMGIFGSYVRGQQKMKSDLDLLVEFDNTIPLSLFDIAGIEHELSCLVGVHVDLVERDAIRPALKKRIMSEAVPL